MKTFKKYLFSFIGVGLAVVVFLPVLGGQTRTKSLYSGEALNYEGRVVIATTNTGNLEIFTLTDAGNLQKFVSFKSYDQRFAKDVDFGDVLLNEEGGRLFAYAVDGRNVFKYDISDLKHAREVAHANDTTWDWFGGLEKIGGYVATVGTNGVTLWTGNLQAYDRYKITTPGNYTFNSTAADSSKYIFTVADSKIMIYDRTTRQQLRDVPLTFNWGGDRYKRAIYNDRASNSIYVVDDEAIRKINFNGEVEKSFDHTGSAGYDVVPSQDGKYIYFSDGIGIVKMRKSDLGVVKYVYTQALAGGDGWAMGLRTVSDANGEKIVAFNGSSILLFDSNLEPVKNVRRELTIATTKEVETYPVVREAVFLKADKNHGAAGSKVIVHGGGYGQNEQLTIKFADQVTTLLADEAGYFNTTLTVPSVPSPRGADINVKGGSTNISYSLGFRIE